MKKNLILSCVLLTAVHSICAPFDRIIAVVDQEIILSSDLDEFESVYRNQPPFSLMSEEERKNAILEKLIDQKVILAVARRDTAILISEGEVEARVKMHLSRVVEENGGEYRFEMLLKQTSGMTLSDFKTQVREQLREEMLKQKLQEKYVGSLDPSGLQVKQFYAKYRDSLPVFKNNYKVSHLEVAVHPNSALLKKAFQKCDSVIRLLNDGADFSELAKSFSDDPSGQEGGDLGFTKRGILDPDYEKTAFRLAPGDYSPAPVKTEYGFHIIKLIAKRDMEIRTSHILFRVVPVAEDTLKTLAWLDSLRSCALKDSSFSHIVEKFSEDKESRENGGLLGWFTRESLNPEYLDIVDSLTDGEISPPVLINGKYHLFRLDRFLDERRLSLEDDWNQISQVAKNYLMSDKINSFLKRWRDEVHIENRSESSAAR